MLTAKTHEDNIVQGLEVGADDYITKPFAPKELIARMKAILRRSSSEEAGNELRVGELVLEIDSRRVMFSQKALEMGPTEFKLLHFFMSHPERAYSRAQLLDRVWGANVYVEERTVDVHIRRLRKALQAGDPIYADLIQTVRGTGYRFSPRDLAVA
jgi:two-component system phosphate regulon response regulator PhoB